MMIGILAGLLAAFCHSICYLYSRRYVMRPGHTAFELFAMSHVIMAGMSLVLLPLLWSPAAPPFRTFAWSLAANCGFYLLGQIGLFTALRWTDASRVSPLLGLKILMLAVITVVCLPSAGLRDLLFLRPITPLQWVAVVACVVAALILNEAGGRIPRPALLCILATCLMYCLSDLSIGVLVEHLRVMGNLHGAIFGCSMSYLLSGLVGLPLLAGRSRPDREKWRTAMPVAVSWLFAMFFLYITFKYIGVLFGNIMQSTRGLMSIGMAVLVLRWRLSARVESHVPPRVFWRRMTAAALMTLGIAAFLVSRRMGW